MNITTAIFDFGNVINKWEPEKAVASIYPTTEEAKAAFEKHDFMGWVGSVMDAGEDVERSLEKIKTVDEERHALLQCYVDNIALAHETLVEGTARLIGALLENGTRVLGMTNCGMAAFEAMQQNAQIVKEMDDVFISAVEKVSKPDAAAYQILLSRNGLSAEHCLFIDDKQENVKAAQQLGMHGIVFVGASQLKLSLLELELLNEEPAI